MAEIHKEVEAVAFEQPSDGEEQQDSRGYKKRM